MTKTRRKYQTKIIVPKASTDLSLKYLEIWRSFLVWSQIKWKRTDLNFVLQANTWLSEARRILYKILQMRWCSWEFLAVLKPKLHHAFSINHNFVISWNRAKLHEIEQQAWLPRNHQNYFVKALIYHVKRAKLAEAVNQNIPIQDQTRISQKSLIG